MGHGRKLGELKSRTKVSKIYLPIFQDGVKKKDIQRKLVLCMLLSLLSFDLWCSQPSIAIASLRFSLFLWSRQSPELRSYPSHNEK